MENIQAKAWFLSFAWKDSSNKIVLSSSIIVHVEGIFSKASTYSYELPVVYYLVRFHGVLSKNPLTHIIHPSHPTPSTPAQEIHPVCLHLHIERIKK